MPTVIRKLTSLGRTSVKVPANPILDRLNNAIKTGDLAVFRATLRLVTDRNVLDSSGMAPIHYAAEYDRQVMAKYLLEKGARANLRTKAGLLPREVANRAKKLDFETNIHRLACETAKKLRPQTHLHQAASQGNLAKLNASLKRGVDIDALNQWYRTPLLEAVFNRSRHIVAALLKAGADPDIARPDGIDPVEKAVLIGEEDILDLLYSAGAAAGGLSEARNRLLFHALVWSRPDEQLPLIPHFIAGANLATKKITILDEAAHKFFNKQKSVLPALASLSERRHSFSTFLHYTGTLPKRKLGKLWYLEIITNQWAARDVDRRLQYRLPTASRDDRKRRYLIRKRLHLAARNTLLREFATREIINQLRSGQTELSTSESEACIGLFRDAFWLSRKNTIVFQKHWRSRYNTPALRLKRMEAIR